MERLRHKPDCHGGPGCTCARDNVSYEVVPVDPVIALTEANEALQRELEIARAVSTEACRELARLQKESLGSQKAVLRLGARYTGETKGDYYYSLNGEDFQGDGQPTRESAVAEAREEHDACGEDEEHFGVWTGRGVKRTCAALADGDTKHSHILDSLFERMRENAYEWVGDHAEGFLEPAWSMGRGPPRRGRKEVRQEEELRYAVMAAIDQWADRHGEHPTFFGVEDVEQH